MSELEQRAAVLKEALSWERTPYHHHAMLKGVGVDCAMLLIAVYQNAGIIKPDPVKPYSPQWFLHHSEERYLDEIKKYAHETNDPKSGDVVVFKMGKTFAHGAIILEPGWPHILHAASWAGMVIQDRGDGGRCQDREHLFFTAW